MQRYKYSWVVKIRNTSEAVYSGHKTPLGHHTDRGPMGLGQYNSLGEYCGPHTASSVFLILIFYIEDISNIFLTDRNIIIIFRKQLHNHKIEPQIIDILNKNTE